MGLHSKVCIGHVETVNLEAKETGSMTESKVVVLRCVGVDKGNKLPIYKPLRNYKEYYKIQKVEPLSGLVSDTKINNALRKTGKQEVERLQRVA